MILQGAAFPYSIPSQTYLTIRRSPLSLSPILTFVPLTGISSPTASILATTLHSGIHTISSEAFSYHPNVPLLSFTQYIFLFYFLYLLTYILSFTRIKNTLLEIPCLSFFNNLFVWLYQVLVVAHGILDIHCNMVVLSLQHVGSSSLTRN